MDGRALFMGTPIFYEGVFIYMRTYYETLGVSADAKTDEIRKNYRRLVKENHPDLHPGDKAAEERFKEIAEAWETLGDEEKRKKYGAGVGQLSTIQSPKISDIIEANPELEGFSMNPYPYIDAWFEAYREERA